MRFEQLETDSSGLFIWATTYREDKVSGRRPHELKHQDKMYAIDLKLWIKKRRFTGWLCFRQ